MCVEDQSSRAFEAKEEEKKNRECTFSHSVCMRLNENSSEVDCTSYSP